jgi:two-component system, cell cycle sensor histidine kinase DivJ
MANIQLELPTHLDLELFISDEAHDLRTPFNHVTGFSKILMSSVGAAYTAEMQKEDLGTVHRSGQRALWLLNGLIDIARLNRHEKEASREDLEILSVVEQGLAHWRKFYPAATLQTEIQISASTSRLSADEALLRQILAGLILYVAQYVDPRAKVTLTVEEEEAWFVFTVTSMGTKVQPFSQLDLKMQGYISRAFIELQHGEIRSAEETDTGASIKFALLKAAAS